MICNFAQGFKQFLDLSLLNLYKDVLNLEPAEVQAFMGIVAIPWTFKIVYGFMSDNIKVFNSKRRGHILMNSGCCILSMTAIMMFGMHFGKYFVTACIFISQINMAYCDTVTDALTVQASKIGVQDGNENLNSFSYLMQAIGAIAGALMAVVVNNTDKIGPFECFGIYLILQSIFFFAALFMNKKLEPGQISNIKSLDVEPPTNENLNQRVSIPDGDDEQMISI